MFKVQVHVLCNFFVVLAMHMANFSNMLYCRLKHESKKKSSSVSASNNGLIPNSNHKWFNHRIWASEKQCQNLPSSAWSLVLVCQSGMCACGSIVLSESSWACEVLSYIFCHPLVSEAQTHSLLWSFAPRRPMTDLLLVSPDPSALMQ